MTVASRISEQLTALFAKQPCWMIRSLAAELGYSVPSVRRFLAAVGYYSSFTHNGKWYTLRPIPSFNRDGLWFHQEMGFSRAGSLAETLTVLTENNPAGVTAGQLGEKTPLPVSYAAGSVVQEEQTAATEGGRLHVPDFHGLMSADSNGFQVLEISHPRPCRPQKFPEFQDSALQQRLSPG